MSATRIYDQLIIGGGRYAASLLNQTTASDQTLAVTDRQLAFPKVGVEAGTAAQQRGVQCELLAGMHVVDLRYDSQGLLLAKTPQGKQLQAKKVTVVAGASTLELAHRMGYGLEYFLLPVRGFSFAVGEQQDRVRYFTFRTHPDQPLSSLDFWRLLRLHTNPLPVLMSLLKSAGMRRLLLAGIGYRLPWIKDRLLTRRAQKLSTETNAEITILGPLPPEQQLVNRKTSQLETQEVRLHPSEDLTFIFPALGQHDISEEKQNEEKQEGLSSDK